MTSPHEPEQPNNIQIIEICNASYMVIYTPSILDSKPDNTPLDDCT